MPHLAPPRQRKLGELQHQLANFTKAKIPSIFDKNPKLISINQIQIQGEGGSLDSKTALPSRAEQVFNNLKLAAHNHHHDHDHDGDVDHKGDEDYDYGNDDEYGDANELVTCRPRLSWMISLPQSVSSVAT